MYGSLFTLADRNGSWQLFFFFSLADAGSWVGHLISGDSGAGGHSRETAPDGVSDGSTPALLCHVQRYERPKHSHSAALTSANPQLRAEVFVSTIALELARQHWSVKKAGGSCFFRRCDKRSEFFRMNSQATAEHEQVEVAGALQRCWVHPSGGRVTDSSQNMETEGYGQLVVIKLEGDRASAVRVLQLWKSLLVELRLLNHPLKVQCAGFRGID